MDLLVRVEDPNAPGALASSAYSATLEAPPESGAWSWEDPPQTQGVGTWETEDVIGYEAWHEAGFTGQGVSIAVFDVQWFGAELEPDELGDVETHDCWAHRGCTVPMDTLNPRFPWETGSHGVACAEIIRDIAPDAEIHLVRVNGGTSLENAGDWVVREGVDLASMSMSFLNNSFNDGSGNTGAVVERMSAGGTLMVVAAGNYADGHWAGDFLDTDLDGVHEFPEYGLLPIWMNPGERSVSVNWDDYADCGDHDLSLRLYDSDGGLLARGDQDQSGDGCSPVERVNARIEESQWVWLEVRLERGSPTNLRINVLSTSGGVWESMPAGSVTDPAANPAAFAVGAVNATGYLDNGPEGFSSQGPTLGGAEKPDIAASDGLSGAVYGSRGFFGTSAATPTAAAAIALVMSRDGVDAFEAARRLQAWARPPGDAWSAQDPGLGAGHLLLPPPRGELPGCGERWLGAAMLLPLGLIRRRGRG